MATRPGLWHVARIEFPGLGASSDALETSVGLGPLAELVGFLVGWAAKRRKALLNVASDK